MNRFLAVFLLILAGSFVAKSQDHARPLSVPTPTPVVIPAGWVNFTSEAGRFNVLLPETATEKTETVQSEHGPYTTHFFVVKNTKSVFVIGWVDYDPNFNFNVTREIEANRDEFVKGIKAKLTSTRPITLDGYQANEFTAESAERVWKSRVYIVGRRPYQLFTGTIIGDDDSINVDRFFNSFKVRLR